MNEIVLQNFKKLNKKHEAIAGIIKGITLTRSVSSTRCAIHIEGEAKLSSKIKRMERCYAKSYLSPNLANNFLCNQFDKESQVVFSLDRTNWEKGNTNINALVLYGAGFETSSMINLKLLDNSGGSSSFNDRKEVLDPVIKHIKSKNGVLLGDREFFSFEFADYLISSDIPFVIRIKQSLNCAKEIIKNLTTIRRTVKNMLIGKFRGKKIYLDVSAKKIKGEYLILVSYKVSNPIKIYKKRWKIECFFKCLKTAGFNIEKTKITALSRLQSLFLLCGMAYVFCVKLGLWVHHNVEKMKFKKTLNCYQFSFFRYGLDWITRMIIPPPNIPKILSFSNMLTNTVR